MVRFLCLSIILICTVFIHCGGDKKILSTFKSTPEAESEVELFKKKGDQEFEKMYYMGWYNAVIFYKKALNLDKTLVEIKEKLFFASFLKALREPLYYIDNSQSRQDTYFWADQLNRSIKTKNPFIYIIGFLLGDKDPTSPEITIESIEELKNVADTDYKCFLYLKYANLRSEKLTRQKRADFFLSQYPFSNLRYFANNNFNDINITLDKYPDFFELLIVRGDFAYQSEKFDDALQYYKSALKIHQVIPPVWYGQGNIYYDFGFVKKALECYDESFKSGLDYFAPLYKKGVCLHDLGRYVESNAVMDIVGKNGILEKGDAFYYKALNHLKLKNYDQVEENIKIAESLSFASFRLNVLAGLFYYQTNRFEKSRNYFEKAKEISSIYPECFYYPGLMDLKEKKMKTALENFHIAAKCYLAFFKVQSQKVNSIAIKNYTPEFKNHLKQLLEKRIKEDATASIQKLEIILNIFSKNKKKEILEIKRNVQYIRKHYLGM